MLGGLVLFILVAISSYRNLLAVEQATNLRAQARQSRLNSSAVLSLLKDVETGQRGYILTGDPAYLVPYETGMAQTGPAFRQLTRSVAAFPAASAALQGMPDLITHRLELARRNIEARQLEGFDAARKQIASQQGRLAMDAVRARFVRLDQLLKTEIDRRNTQVASLRRQALWSNLALTLLGIVLTATGYFLQLREQKRRIRAEQALLEANLHLEDAVTRRTAELEQARHEIEAFALRLDRGIEAERHRLAREVHDQLGQIFTALRMTLNHTLKGNPETAGSVARMDDLLVEGIVTARRIAGELRPPLLDDLGLGAALTHRAQRFAEETGMACEVALQQDDRLRPEQATQLYRIAQEALTNVMRHAGASRLWIEGRASDGQYWLVIEDDGRGMAIPDASSLGLLSMRERAALADGRLELGPGRAGGLRVLVRLPLNPDPKEADAHPDH